MTSDIMIFVKFTLAIFNGGFLQVEEVFVSFLFQYFEIFFQT